MEYYYIYRLIFNDTVIYIGQTTDIKKRLWEHKSVRFNENSKPYRKPLYKFIREQCISREELNDKIIMEEIMKHENKYTADLLEDFHINQYGNLLNSQRGNVYYQKHCKEN